MLAEDRLLIPTDLLAFSLHCFRVISQNLQWNPRLFLPLLNLFCHFSTKIWNRVVVNHEHLQMTGKQFKEIMFSLKLLKPKKLLSCWKQRKQRTPVAKGVQNFAAMAKQAKSIAVKICSLGSGWVTNLHSGSVHTSYWHYEEEGIIVLTFPSNFSKREIIICSLSVFAKIRLRENIL